VFNSTEYFLYVLTNSMSTAAGYSVSPIEGAVTKAGAKLTPVTVATLAAGELPVAWCFDKFIKVTALSPGGAAIAMTLPDADAFKAAGVPLVPGTCGMFAIQNNDVTAGDDINFAANTTGRLNPAIAVGDAGEVAVVYWVINKDLIPVYAIENETFTGTDA
jgi:hypothetical protein